MPVTQRETDIMQLESQMRIEEILAEWKVGFLGERMPLETITSDSLSLDEPAEQEIPNDDSVLVGA